MATTAFVHKNLAAHSLIASMSDGSRVTSLLNIVNARQHLKLNAETLQDMSAERIK